MAAEFIRIGRVTRCREVNRSYDANGNMVEIWGDYLPASYCQFGRVQRPGGLRLSIIPDPTLLDGAPQTTGCTSCGAAGQGQGTKAIKIIAVTLLLLWAFSAFKK